MLAAADDTVAVWAVAGDLGAGDAVTADDLVVRRVRFAEAADLDRYFGGDDALPDGLQLVRGRRRRRAAAAHARSARPATSGLLQVPVAVDAERVPPSVAAGSVVDVYVARRRAAAGAPPARAGAHRPSR